MGGARFDEFQDKGLLSKYNSGEELAISNAIAM